jgi:excinuclease ABC subunit C
VSKAEYRAGIDGVIAFLSGHFHEIEKELVVKMDLASEQLDYEQAAIERNRLQAVRSLLERQRVARDAAGSFDAVAVALEEKEANAHVFQIRDGVLSDRQSFYLDNEAEQPLTRVVEEFILQYYSTGLSIPPLIVLQPQLEDGELVTPVNELEALLNERRAGPVELRVAERGDKRRLAELAEKNARLALDQQRLKSERQRHLRAQSLEELREALKLDALPVRIECFDISNLGGTHTTASMVVFEGGVQKKSDYRRFTIRTVSGSDDFASMSEVLSRRYAQWERYAELSPYDSNRDESFAAQPNLIVIDGGKGQLSAGVGALQGFRDRGTMVISLAKRIEEIFIPGQGNPLLLGHDTAGLQLLPRIRDEAHRFAVTHHKIRRDKAMVKSAIDDLPGIGPARKQALLRHFGSPDAVLEASREELEAVPGLPAKIARQVYAYINRLWR